MNSTGMKDANGCDIKLGDTVELGEEWYTVKVNLSSLRTVIEGDAGQFPLIEVHSMCVVIDETD